MIRALRRRGALAGALVALLIGLTGCWPRVPAPTSAGWMNDRSGPGPAVAVVGDSLIAYDPAWPTCELAGRGPLAVWARAGAGYGAQGRWLETLGRPIDVVVYALGANDANTLYGQDGWSQADLLRLHRLAGVLDRSARPRRPVVLVTVAPHPEAPLAYRVAAGRANQEVRRLGATWEHITVADWARVAAGQRAYYSDRMVHLSTVGSAHYRRTLADGAARALRSGGAAVVPPAPTSEAGPEATTTTTTPQATIPETTLPETTIPVASTTVTEPAVTEPAVTDTP